MGVTYFKLIPEKKYEGDVTLNGSLRGEDMDANFYFLRGYDINTIGFDDDHKLVLTRLDGSIVNDPVDIAGELGVTDIHFDPSTGTLTLDTADGRHLETTGFISIENNLKVATDGTLNGSGNFNDPLRIATTEKTGTYSAADEYRDLTNGSDTTLTVEIAERDSIPTGYRIVTKENVSELGRLYNLAEMRQMQTVLSNDSSEWRVPSKADWNKLLDYVEAEAWAKNCEPGETPTHESNESSIDLGKYAGKMLKARKMWNNATPDAIGVDKYEFSVLPVGYILKTNQAGTSGDGDVIDYLYKSAGFWCDAPISNDSFAKFFDDDKATVSQSVEGPDTKLSIRLVKDYDGTNQEPCEYIPTIGMTVFTKQIGDQIWTDMNVSSSIFGGVYPAEWDTIAGDVTTDVVFLINEWDGETWIKSRLTVGNSIVMKTYDDPNYPEPLEYHEYRVTINKETGEENFEDTVGLLEKEIDEELDSIGRIVVEANNKCDALEQIVGDGVSGKTLSEAVVEAESTIEEFRSQLGDMDEQVNAKITTLDNKVDRLDGRVTDLESASGDLNTAINDEKLARIEAVNELNSIIGNGFSSDADSTVTDKVRIINETLSNHAATIQDVSNSVSNEAISRSTADNALQAQITKNKVTSANGTINVNTGSTEGTDISVNIDGLTLKTDTGGLIKVADFGIVKVEQPSGSTIACSYKLCYNGSDEALGTTIDIYRDALIDDVKIYDTNAWVDGAGHLQPGSSNPNGMGTGEPALCFLFIRADGKKEPLCIELTTFLEENEFANGLQVIDHVVSVKISRLDEGFLKVDETGIYTSGITGTVNTMISSAVESEASARTTADEAIQTLITTETQLREYAVNAEHEAMLAAVSAETSAREAAISGEVSARDAAIAVETGARELADTQLANSIEVEALAREDADTTLGQNLEAVNSALTQRIVDLEAEVERLNNLITALTNTEAFNNAVKEVMLTTLTGWPQQIELKKYDAYDNEVNTVADVAKVKIKFAHDAQFIADV